MNVKYGNVEREIYLNDAYPPQYYSSCGRFGENNEVECERIQEEIKGNFKYCYHLYLVGD